MWFCWPKYYLFVACLLWEGLEIGSQVWSCFFGSAKRDAHSSLVKRSPFPPTSLMLGEKAGKASVPGESPLAQPLPASGVWESRADANWPLCETLTVADHEGTPPHVILRLTWANQWDLRLLLKEGCLSVLSAFQVLLSERSEEDFVFIALLLNRAAGN